MSKIIKPKSDERYQQQKDLTNASTKYVYALKVFWNKLARGCIKKNVSEKTI